MSEAAVSLLLSPLSLYSWMTSTLLRFLLSVPALVFSSWYHSLLLILAGPWCVATVCFSLLVTGLHVSLYLLHLGLVAGAVAILAVRQHKMADGDTPREKVLSLQKSVEGQQTKSRLLIGKRAAQQG